MSPAVAPLAGRDDLAARFLALLPRIERHAHFYFRHLKATERLDAVAEACAVKLFRIAAHSPPRSKPEKLTHP
jgi:hypothetical protein